MTNKHKLMDYKTAELVEHYWGLRQELSQLTEDAQIVGKDLKKRLRAGNIYVSDRFKAQKVRVESPAHVVSKCTYDQLIVTEVSK